MTPAEFAALEALVAAGDRIIPMRAWGGKLTIEWLEAWQAWKEAHAAARPALTAALAEIRALPALLEGLELTTPTELGPMFDVGWTAALRTLKDRLAARAPAAPEGT